MIAGDGIGKGTAGKRTRREEALQRRVELHTRRFAACAAELRARGVDPAAVFALTANVHEDRRDATCDVVPAGHAFFVRHDTAAGVDDGPSVRRWVPVGDASGHVFERRDGLALFAQLLMNGACDLHDVDAVLDVFAVVTPDAIVRTREQADALVARGAPADLVALFEPPHVAARTLRFCVENGDGAFGVVTVDVETCAVAFERRCAGVPVPSYGRLYVDADAAPDGRAPRVAALVLAAFLNGRSP